MARRPKHGTIYQRNKIWWIKYYSRGQPVYESSRSIRPEDAERLLRKRLGEIATGAYRGTGVERTTLNDLFELVVADYQETGKRSLDDVLSRLKLHLRPRLGKLRAVDFGPLIFASTKLPARRTRRSRPQSTENSVS
jgi:hypothetical protein